MTHVIVDGNNAVRHTPAEIGAVGGRSDIRCRIEHVRRSVQIPTRVAPREYQTALIQYHLLCYSYTLQILINTPSFVIDIKFKSLLFHSVFMLDSVKYKHILV